MTRFDPNSFFAHERQEASGQEASPPISRFAQVPQADGGGGFDYQERDRQRASIQETLRPQSVRNFSDRTQRSANVWTGISLALIAREVYVRSQRRQVAQYDYVETPVEVTGTRVVRETEQGELPAVGGFWANTTVQFIGIVLLILTLIMIAG